MVQTGDKKPADKAGQDGKAAESKPAEEPKPFSTPDALQGIVSLLEKSVKTKDTRLLMGRLLRQTAQVRKHLTGAHLEAFIKNNVPESVPAHAYLLAATQQVRQLLQGSDALAYTICSSHTQNACLIGCVHMTA